MRDENNNPSGDTSKSAGENERPVSVQQSIPEPEQPAPEQPAPEQPEQPAPEQPEQPAGEVLDDDDDRDNFPREYVEKLRGEAGRHRKAAREAAERADDLARRYVTARVAALGELADPGDLPYDDSLVDADDAALSARVAELLTRRPGLRRVGATGALPAREESAAGVSLVDMLRGSL